MGLKLFARRGPAGPTIPFTVPMILTDACETWNTFAGGGGNVP